MKNNTIRLFLFLFGFFMIAQFSGFSQYRFNGNEILTFQKKELNWGAIYNTAHEREEFRSNLTREYDELTSGEVKFQLNNSYWNFQDLKQENIAFNFEVGPLWGNGNLIDSSAIENIVAEHKIFGLRADASVSFASRFYHTPASYTLVQVNAWARYDWFKQNSTGTSTDSNNVVSNINDELNKTKFRYGFEARAGWGFGRLSPMNHFMVADYLLEKYYSGRNFSQAEISGFASEIGSIKHQRNLHEWHKTDKESEQINAFINGKMLLTPIEMLKEEWEMGEFLPRFHGSRVGFGPFFRYYNREPDFIYGGYFQYENAKYINHSWNRIFSANIEYNRYKKQDWVLSELNIGWSYFMKLKDQLDFGLKYVPGVALNNLEKIGEFNHGFIPYVGYFTQFNSKTRINIALALRISEDENLMLPGPELSLSVYRSRY